MPEIPGGDAAPRPSLSTSVRTFWSVLLATFYTRLDLVTTELEDEAARAIKTAIAGLISLLAFHAAFFFAMFFLLALVWDTSARLWVVGGICLVYLLVGALGLFFARDFLQNRPRFLSQSIAELRRDVENMNRAAAQPKPEEKLP